MLRGKRVNSNFLFPSQRLIFLKTKTVIDETTWEVEFLRIALFNFSFFAFVIYRENPPPVVLLIESKVRIPYSIIPGFIVKFVR